MASTDKIEADFSEKYEKNRDGCSDKSKLSRTALDDAIEDLDIAPLNSTLPDKPLINSHSTDSRLLDQPLYETAQPGEQSVVFSSIGDPDVDLPEESEKESVARRQPQPHKLTAQNILTALQALPPIPTTDNSDFIVLDPPEDERAALLDLIDRLRTPLSPIEMQLLLKAYIVASYAHRNQTRQSGEAYVFHPIEVTAILAEMSMDVDTLAAGLLHDVAEDTDYSIDYIQSQFGKTISVMVDGVTKLKRINQLSNVRQGVADQKAESLRKMFLAMVEDVRVVLIKLADRLHNMRTLESQPDHKKRRIARETLEIFAPLANRLGIAQIKWELEDMSFRYLEPAKYKQLARAMDQKRTEREAWIEEVKEKLIAELAASGIKAEITGRPKHIYSIWRKMQRKEIGFEQIYDVHGFRVLVDSEADCYAALGIVHALWRPIPGEFDDYIANPKDNMYRSLHTAVLSRTKGRPMEVQIRTHEMHQVSEYGIAAHWRYKEQTKHDRQFEDNIAWLRQLMEWRQDVTDADEFVDGMKTDVFNDRVYVFTPQGDVIDLPAGSTAIDFAYAIHTELGHRCRGANVDGRLMPLDYKLKNGEQVSVIAAKRGGPTRDWLNPNLEYVATQRARSKIRAWLKRQNRDDNIRQGKQVLDKELRRLSISQSLESIAELFSFEETDDFLAAIGYGEVNSQHIAQRLLEHERKEKEEAQLAKGIIPNRSTRARQGDPRSTPGVHVQGLEGVMTQPGRCCSPIPGDTIIGYTTIGRGVTIHRRDCPNIVSKIRSGRNNRMIEVQWSSDENEFFKVNIHVQAYDRPNLLRDFTLLVAEERINLPHVEAVTGNQDNMAIINATLEISDVRQLTRILTKIDRMPNVIETRRKIS